MGSNTSNLSHRCLFNTAGSESRRGFWAKCTLCGRASAWQKMLKCERDDCHHGYAHKRCVEGALGCDQREDFGHQPIRSDNDVHGRIAADLRLRPVDTADSESSSTQTDRYNQPAATTDANTQTDRYHVPAATADANTQTDGESCTANVTYVDGFTQTASVATSDVACGDEITCADASSQTSVVACHVESSGSDTVFAGGSSQTCSAATCEVKAGLDCLYSICEICNCRPTSSDVEAVFANCLCLARENTCPVVSEDGLCSKSEITCSVASEDEDIFVDRLNSTSQTTDPIVSEIKVIFEKGSSTTNETTVADTEPKNIQDSTFIPTHEYWKLRYTLFSKFDAGIMLDEDSLRSTCTEVLARNLANNCWYETVLNPFCGAGGNAIQLAFTCSQVIAMDVDPNKIALAKRNAEIYGVADRIDFRVGDFFGMDSDLRVDAVITSPPWAELGYARQAEFDAGDFFNHESGVLVTIIRIASALAPKVVLQLPKDIDQIQCLQMATNKRFSHIKYESMMIDKEPKCQNIYATRNDTNAKGPPLMFFGEVHLRTPTLLKKRRLERANTDTMIAYTSYLKSVDRFLDT